LSLARFSPKEGIKSIFANNTVKRLLDTILGHLHAMDQVGLYGFYSYSSEDEAEGHSNNETQAEWHHPKEDSYIRHGNWAVLVDEITQRC